MLLSGTNVEQSNDFLASYVETESAWFTSLELLCSSNENVQYFVSNMLYTKVKKHWQYLMPAQQEQVRSIIFKTISSMMTPDTMAKRRPLITRLIMCLSNIYIRMPQGIYVYIQSAATIIANAEGNNSARQAGLDFLMLLPVEVESFVCIKAEQVALEGQLSQSVETGIYLLIAFYLHMLY